MLLRVLQYPGRLDPKGGRQDRSLGKACILDCLHLSPGRWDVWLRKTRVVDEIQVNVFNPKLSVAWFVSHNITQGGQRSSTHVLETILNGSFDIKSVEPGVFGRDENILSCESALPHGFPCLFFVAVNLGGVWTYRVSRKRI